MIRVEHLTKNYGPRVAVADITFDVGQGEVLGFLGPNGAGKTTTMRILTGYLPPSGGRAEVEGFDVATQSLQARAKIGYLPETVPLYHDMSVRSYLDFMAKIKGAKERRREVDRAMEKARIAHRANDQIGKLVLPLLFVMLGLLMYAGLQCRLRRGPAAAVAALGEIHQRVPGRTE